MTPSSDTKTLCPERVGFRLTGPVGIERGGDLIDIESTAARTLLAILALERRTYVETSRLIMYLWDAPPKSARVNLRGYVRDLRRQLDAIDDDLTGRIVTLRGKGGGYSLRVDDDAVDVARFSRLTNDGSAHLRSGQSAEAAACFTEALSVWKGPMAQGCGGSSALSSRFAAFDDLHVMARERLVTARIVEGETAELIPEIRDLLATAPYREAPWGLMMRASYLSGDIAVAIDAWKRAVATLSNEFGLEPSRELADLYKAILDRHDDRVRTSGIGSERR